MEDFCRYRLDGIVDRNFGFTILEMMIFLLKSFLLWLSKN